MKNYPLDQISLEEIQALCGINNQNIAFIEKTFKTDVAFRNNEIIVQEDDKAEAVFSFVKRALKLLKKKESLDAHDLNYLADHVADEEALVNQPVGKTFSGKLIYPKTAGQIRLVNAIRKYDVLFAVGPAGTGKTYLSVIYACSLLKDNQIKKIILTRPAVEAGENLGFLPGDLKEKVDPYLQPLYDALYDSLGKENVEKLMERGVIEIAPLAYMRGRTLDDALIILDEAQNTTREQMKMFLTRMGENAKVFITGDITQVDLPKRQKSGLVHAMQILEEIPEISMIHLSDADVVRSSLVRKIVQAYQNEVKND